MIGERSHTSLGSGAEFDTIRRLVEQWDSRARGIGDDAAVITLPAGSSLVASTDASVENVHFRREWLSPQEIGYRAAASALSDLAAMAARPLGMLVAMAIPETWRDSLDQLASGIGEAAAAADAPILGGDMSRASELSLTVTVLGHGRMLLYRKNAHAGDRVYVTGRIGGAGAALAAFENGGIPTESDRRRFARPSPRIREAIWLADHGATSAVDVSDGLTADLGHIAAASHAGIVVHLEKIVIASGVSLHDAVRSGEEYELAVTSPVDIDTRAFEATFALELTQVGIVEEGSGVRLLLHGDQVETPPGYLHFKQ